VSGYNFFKHDDDDLSDEPLTLEGFGEQILNSLRKH
jgi:hypothetical protein